MQHTYFLEPLEWTAEGTYYDAQGKAFPLTGAVRVVRSDTEWSLRGYLEVAFQPPARFFNDYQIQEQSEFSLLWESFNPALGTLRGSFELFGNAIMSHYRSEDGVFSGAETLLMRDPQTYENTGVSFKNGRRLSAWTAVLRANRPSDL